MSILGRFFFGHFVQKRTELVKKENYRNQINIYGYLEKTGNPTEYLLTIPWGVNYEILEQCSSKTSQKVCPVNISGIPSNAQYSISNFVAFAFS